MDYRIFKMSSGEGESSVEAHVFARAYRAVWRVKNLAEPCGAHQFTPLDLVICYGGCPLPLVAIPDDDAVPAGSRPALRSGGNEQSDDH